MYLTYENIEERALDFLNSFDLASRIPVPIEEIIEIHLELTIVPMKSLLEEHSIDAFLSHDMTTLYIDEDHYIKQTNRSRFTLAHEAGHIALHRDFITENVKTLDEWKNKILGAGTGRAYYETQANHFAGCLLMPREEILLAYNENEDKAKRAFQEIGMEIPDRDLLIPYVANDIARMFEVSNQAAEIRLKMLLSKNS